MCTGSVSRAATSEGSACHDDADEALHVGRAAAVEASVTDLRLERRGLPVLSVDRHDVGVPRQDDAAIGAAVVGRDRGQQVGLGPVVGGQDRR